MFVKKTPPCRSPRFLILVVFGSLGPAILCSLDEALALGPLPTIPAHLPVPRYPVRNCRTTFKAISGRVPQTQQTFEVEVGLLILYRNYVAQRLTYEVGRHKWVHTSLLYGIECLNGDESPSKGGDIEYICMTHGGPSNQRKAS